MSAAKGSPKLTVASSFRSWVRYQNFGPHAGGKRVLRLARTHRLKVYDAAYLELAQRHRVELATLDAGLMEAAQARLGELQRRPQTAVFCSLRLLHLRDKPRTSHAA